VGEVPFALVVNNAVPVRTTAELIAYGKSNPGKLSFPYASSTAQVAGETLRVMSVSKQSPWRTNRARRRRPI